MNTNHSSTPPRIVEVNANAPNDEILRGWEKVLSTPATECSCGACVSSCFQSPCFPEPREVEGLINAGVKLHPAIYANSSLRYPFPVLAPEYNRSTGSCSLLINRLCSIHDIKPLEGRLAHHKMGKGDHLRNSVCLTWLSDKGLEVMEKYGDERGVALLKGAIAFFGKFPNYQDIQL